jgi:hypothetical protein
MKNAVIYYVVIALGVLALAVSAYYFFLNTPHAVRAFTALGAGVLLLIIGIAGMVMGRSKAVAK